MNLYGLRYNHTSRYYEITEKGITYSMELSEMHMLKKSTELSVEYWYMSLGLENRIKIKRSGNIVSSQDEFYPEAEYD